MIEYGIINIKKPNSWTSQDVVAKLRRCLKTKRVGHTGTLDPMATGVLPICFGKATRIIEYYDDDLKTYRAEMKLGFVSDTLDCTGQILETHDVHVTEEEIRAAFSTMSGWVEQIPPKYSALKVNGRRLYDYARSGVEVEIKSRRIFIDRIQLNRVDLKENILEFTVTCSKGTYIRTICDDIGRMLGCGAMMTSLVRTKSGVFDISDSHTLEEVLEMSEEKLQSIVISMEETLPNFGRARLKSNRSVPFYRNGRDIDEGFIDVEEEPSAPSFRGNTSDHRNKYRVYDAEGVFLGISRRENGVFYPEKVIG